MFIAQAAAGDNRWWKYGLAIISVVGATLVGQIPLTLLSYQQKNKLGISDDQFSAYLAKADYYALGISENTFLFLLLLTFLCAFLAMVWIWPILHRRPAKSFITSRKSFDFVRLGVGLIIWFALASLITFLVLDPADYSFNFRPEKFFLLVIIALLLVPFQTAAEELFFRGYLLQSLYRLFGSKWAALLLTTLLFAAVHIYNPEFEHGLLKVLPPYLVLSFLLGYITLLDGGLELPIGIHTGNNLFVALILSASDGALSTPSLFKTEVESLIGILPVLFVVLGVGSFLLLKWRYRWALKL